MFLRTRSACARTVISHGGEHYHYDVKPVQPRTWRSYLPSLKATTLFVGMYAITATIVGVETGSLVTGLTIGLVGSTVKTGWAMLHAFIFGASH